MAMAVLVVGASRASIAAGQQDLGLWRSMALDLVNMARRERGLSQLSLGAGLDAAAQSHAEDMLKRHYYAHTSPDGRDVQDRFTAAGGSKWLLVEENIARCKACRPPISDAMIRRLQQGWMQSPHHRENILRRGLGAFGYGIVVDDAQGLYAVQTFSGAGTPRGSKGEPSHAVERERLPRRFAEILNSARRSADAGEVHADASLNQVAQSLLPAGTSDTVHLPGGRALYERLPEQDRADWASLAVLEAACGGCGQTPTDADLRFFRHEWLNDRDHRGRLLDRTVTAIGFALQANGDGRKVAVLVLGTHR